MRRPGAPLPIAGPLATGLALAACTGAADAGPSHTVSDSAGIEIVHSSRPAWTPRTAWRVEAEPALEVGQVSGEDAYVLDRVMGVTVLEDGGIAIAHMGDNTIRYYDANGGFLRKVGGSGGGPEEFRQLMGLWRVGDEIWGVQLGGLPLKVFDPSRGMILMTIPLVSASPSPPEMVIATSSAPATCGMFPPPPLPPAHPMLMPLA